MRGIALLSLILLAWLAVPPAGADTIDVLQASLRATEEGLVLDADFGPAPGRPAGMRHAFLRWN